MQAIKRMIGSALLLRSSAMSSSGTDNLRYLSTSCALHKREDRRVLLNSMPKKDEGVQGSQSKDIDMTRVRASSFPDENTPNLMFDGVPFSQLPICHIKCSLNNTHMDVTDHTGRLIAYKTGGTEGYKNARKGTTVAAQAAATSLSYKMLSYSLKNVRVIIKGLGPGRLSSLKGLQMAGINVVSITDHTYAPYAYRRPRKAKRL